MFVVNDDKVILESEFEFIYNSLCDVVDLLKENADDTEVFEKLYPALIKSKLWYSYYKGNPDGK